MHKHLESFQAIKNFSVPQTMQALLVKGRGFENLEIAEVPMNSNKAQLW